jgi:hypothetical protein
MHLNLHGHQHHDQACDHSKRLCLQYDSDCFVERYACPVGKLDTTVHGFELDLGLALAVDLCPQPGAFGVQQFIGRESAPPDAAFAVPAVAA